jgi:hypothetical protein
LIEGDDVGLQTFEYGARLFRRAGMRLVDGDVDARVRFVLGDERLVDLRVQLARHVIGDVEDIRGPFGTCWAGRKNGGCRDDGDESGHGWPLGCVVAAFD